MNLRFRGHSMGDPERYRKQEEVKKWKSKTDWPFCDYLTSNKYATSENSSRSMSESKEKFRSGRIR